MATPDYFIEFQAFKHMTLAELSCHLRKMPKKCVGDVTIAELCSMAEFPNGLYLLFDEQDELWYVGKATSRSFIERVPSHFDQREDAWFNTVPRKIMTFSKMAVYGDAHKLGLSLHLALVGVRSKASAMSLERMLRSFMTPHLNPERKRSFTGQESLAAVEA